MDIEQYEIENGGVYLTDAECKMIVATHNTGEQARDLACMELEAIKDKLMQISCLAFDDARLNRKLLCSLVDELEHLLKGFELPPAVECNERVASAAYDADNLLARKIMMYKQWKKAGRI